MSNSKKDFSFIAGALTLFIWSIVPAISTFLSENMSPFVSGSITSIVGGSLIFSYRLINKKLAPIKEIDKRYWLICGGAMIFYNLCNTSAYYTIADRQGAMLVNLFSSLWSICTLVFTIFVLKQKVKKGICFTLPLCIVGIVLATSAGFSGSIIQTFKDNWLPILFGIGGSISWGIYSSFYCKLVTDEKQDYQPLFQIIYGTILACISTFNHIRIERFTPIGVFSLFFEAIISIILSNILWGIALRGKAKISVILLSNLSPVLQIVVSSIVLQTPVSFQFVLGGFIVALATFLTKKCIIE